jgi:hypothetical protein
LRLRPYQFQLCRDIRTARLGLLAQGVASMNRKVQEATNGALRANQDPTASLKKLKTEGVKG